MGLTTALNTAMSGLTAAARQAQVTSANIANAMTEGYVPRQIGLSAAALGGVGNGVRVTGILRQGDPVLASLTRSACTGKSDPASRVLPGAASRESGDSLSCPAVAFWP